MKVLYIIHSTIMGGATISFLNMLNILIKKGVRPVVVLPKSRSLPYDEVFLEKIKKMNVETYEAPVTFTIREGSSPPRNKKIFLWIFRKYFGWLKRLYGQYILSSVAKKVKPDIIHTNTGVIQDGYKVSQKLGIPHVWHLREFQDIDFHWDFYPSKSKFVDYLRKSYVISITNAILEHFSLTGSDCAQTIYNGVFSDQDICFEFPKQHYFLCASRISEAKGFSEVVKAFSEFVQDKNFFDYRLKIAGFGDPGYIDYLKKLARERGCLDRIDFLGYCEDVRPLMKNARALIVASYNEGFGRMTAEAAFCGCAVIGRNRAGTKEILDALGEFPYDGNEVQLCQCMQMVAGLSEKELMDVTLVAQKKATKLYSIEQNGEKIYELYKSICG